METPTFKAILRGGDLDGEEIDLAVGSNSFQRLFYEQVDAGPRVLVATGPVYTLTNRTACSATGEHLPVLTTPAQPHEQPH